MHVSVQRVDVDKLIDGVPSEDSATVRQRVTAARQRQWRRFAEHPAVTCNAEMRLAEMRAFCQLDSAGSALQEAAPLVMRSVQKGILHKNTASRKVSRMTKQLKALAK